MNDMEAAENMIQGIKTAILNHPKNRHLTPSEREIYWRGTLEGQRTYIRMFLNVPETAMIYAYAVMNTCDCDMCKAGDKHELAPKDKAAIDELTRMMNLKTEEPKSD